MAEEYRTVMYSVGEKGEVMVHRFPWNANEKIGMQKLRRLEARGFTFEDPRKGNLSEDTVGIEIPTDKIHCSECGRECKSEFGLKVHRRVHLRE